MLFEERKENVLKMEMANLSSSTNTRQGNEALKIMNLSKIFVINGSHVTVLNNISLNARTGEMICILGRSGCGKTTLLNVLAGFLPASSGTVLLNGQPVKEPGPDRCVVFHPVSGSVFARRGRCPRLHAAAGLTNAPFFLNRVLFWRAPRRIFWRTRPTKPGPEKWIR